MNNTQFDRVIGAVNDISNGRLGNAALFIKLVLGHVLFFEKLLKTLANGPI